MTRRSDTVWKLFVGSIDMWSQVVHLAVMSLRKDVAMNQQGSDLLDAAHCALHDFTDASRTAVMTPSTSPSFGKAQIHIAQTQAFQDAMLAALRSRFAEIKTVTK